MTYALTWFTMATDKFTVYCTQYIRLGVGLLSWPILFVLFINIVSTGRSPVSLETPLFLTDFLYSFSWCITANISIERCLLVAKQRKCENSVSQNFLIVVIITLLIPMLIISFLRSFICEEPFDTKIQLETETFFLSFDLVSIIITLIQ